MAPTAVQYACGVFALATPLLLAAGYYAQLLLDRLGERRELLITVFVTACACVGEAAALVGVVQPHRVCAAVGAVGTAISGTGVVSVPFYAARLRKKQRRSGHHVAEGQRPNPARPHGGGHGLARHSGSGTHSSPGSHSNPGSRGN